MPKNRGFIIMKNLFENSDSSIPFSLGVAHQKYLSAEKGIEEASTTGCSHWYIDGSLHGDMVSDWNQSRINNLKDYIAKTGVQPIFHGNFKAPLGSDVNELRVSAVEYVKKEIDIASQIGAPLIIHGGCIVEPKKVLKAKKIAIDNFIQSIKELSDYAKSVSVDIYLENLSNYKNYLPFHYIFTNIEEYEYVFNQIIDQGNVYMFLDIGHANICQGDSVEVIKKYASRIKAISFSNNNGIKDQHLSINMGTINYKDIVNTITECNWKGIVAFEVRDKSTEEAVSELARICSEVNSQNHANFSTPELEIA